MYMSDSSAASPMNAPAAHLSLELLVLELYVFLAVKHVTIRKEHED
jgi:hypothetical protein